MTSSLAHQNVSGVHRKMSGRAGQLHIEPSPIHFRIPIETKQSPKTLYTDIKPLSKDDALMMESRHAFLLWEDDSPYCRLAFPRSDAAFLEDANGSGLRMSSEPPPDSPSKLANQYFDLYLKGKLYNRWAAWTFSRSTPLTESTSSDAPAPDQLIVLRTDKFPPIWEEESIQHGGVRNPYHRVDLVPSKRHVQIYAKSKDGKEEYLVADTANIVSPQHAFALFESRFPTRWYLPTSALTSTGSIKLRPSAGAKLEEYDEDGLVTVCPYKGYARYHHLTLPDGDTLENIAWAYPVQIPAFDARQLVAFYTPGQDRLKLVVDGEEVKS
ncbi:uncharacterized protein FA14DRAFT_160514 [Meira miltonrushii]|uniref:DUF427 domain-containing protein n=1 Tax=Meira miltonrushii TaxID=1280837 RepID=A0A316VCF0_9BASI|nr:uncharacterized protein FA14DRAFT_160514 [Meira miltonrushii]PWN35309.1 hypothetical protein FA14DRAFT_160514 [Meira miltonrushii]